MDASFSIWKMLAGVAFFLLAMNFMEASLKHLANRKFKLFIKYQTHNKLKAIGGGAIATGLLQSSSIVNLLVLSMVGAGVVQMENALAIILGSNLGSTFSSWIVALFGFDYNIENLMLPIAGVAGILMAFINTESKKYLWLKFMFSLAFLFIAFGFIKTGMEGFVKQTDLSVFTQYPVIIFLLLGVLLTAIVQSSSATMALALSALYTNAISLYVATAIILGSEIGTTLKLFFVPANGIAAKKRVALGNFLFNCITVFFIFILLWPINNLITNVLKITNKLFALVFFQTFINFCSIILFTPF
ncbi:MAG: Na/Pi cotransporter family protein [Chitinophagaceae bacterium]|nr:Na/Pi cotransporter family protein [Chitinophagaceae bacterium]